MRSGRILAVGEVGRGAGGGRARRAAVRPRRRHAGARLRRRSRALHAGRERARLGRPVAAAGRATSATIEDMIARAARAAATGSRPSTSTSWASATTTRCSRSGATRPRRTWIASRPSSRSGRSTPRATWRSATAWRSIRRASPRPRPIRRRARRPRHRPSARLARADGPAARGGLGARPADAVSDGPRTPPSGPDATDRRALRAPRDHHRAGRRHRRRRHADAARGGRRRLAADRRRRLSAVPARASACRAVRRALPAGLPGRRARRRREDRPRRLAAGQDRLADRAVPGRAGRRAAVLCRGAAVLERRRATGSWRTASRAACRCSRTRTGTPPPSR